MPQIVAPQAGPQVHLLTCPVTETFFGGARGGGKTFGFLLDWIKHSKLYGPFARGIFFRRSYPELEDAMDKSQRLLPLIGAKWLEQKKSWFMADGGILKMRYLDRDADADNYQGHEYNWMAFDEAEHWPSPAPLNKIRACLRSADGVRCVLRVSANPGGSGHNWLKSRYIKPAPPYSIHKDPDTGHSVVFIPSSLKDNKLLCANDPEYGNRLKGTGPDWLVKAWLEGDWDIVAGGMFDDVWDKRYNTIEPFDIPRTWRIDRSFDWGSSKPFSVLWWAESDGCEVKLRSGKTKTFPKGTVFLIAEWYGTNGKPNEGLNMLDTEIAKGIWEREKAMVHAKMVGKIHPGPADSAIFDTQNGICIADRMAAAPYHVSWVRADKSPGSRVNGWQIMRTMLKAAGKFPMDDPALIAFDTCRHWISHIPSLPRDQKKIDDVDSDTEDHDGDATRYRLSKKKVISLSSEELNI